VPDIKLRKVGDFGLRAIEDRARKLKGHVGGVCSAVEKSTRTAAEISSQPFKVMSEQAGAEQANHSLRQ